LAAGYPPFFEHFVTTPLPPDSTRPIPIHIDWRANTPGESHYIPVLRRPPLKSLILAAILLLLTFCTCLAAGTQFANAYSQNQAASFEQFVLAYKLFYLQPAGLAAGLPFALTLLTIFLAHELGHFFACRYHHIRASFPLFLPFPSLIGTFGAFILIRSPIRTNRALFDVGASGPLAGFVFALPALLYGILHAKLVPGLADLNHTDIVFGTPLLLRLLYAKVYPGVAFSAVLLPPVGRAAWVGLFVTSMNLLPVGQLDGGHVLRSISARLHRVTSLLVPFVLFALGLLHFWPSWYVWGALLLAMRFLRVAPIYDPTPLDPVRRFGAFFTLIVFLLSFMLAPVLA
jgi:membrane-associated protease RseP (regulator of RpoE activity)